jgi:hypothetical protein
MAGPTESDGSSSGRPLSVRNGFVVWMDQPSELEALRRLLVLPNARETLRTLAEFPGTERERIWARGSEAYAIVQAWDRMLGMVEPSTTQGFDRLTAQLSYMDDGSRLLDLYVATKVVLDLWKAEKGENALSLALVMPEDAGTEAEATPDEAALVFVPGSLTVYISYKAILKAAKWGLVFTLKRGRVGSQIAEQLYMDLRQRREAEAQHRLLDIRKAKPGMVFDKCGIVIFLHGLLSSDLILFDPIIERLSEDKKLRDRYVHFGFPHDTFASIEANAEELTEELGLLLQGDQQTPVGFVCHSRGGLLARRVAANLFTSAPARWQQQLVCGVTFGTPHKGSPLAERGQELIAAMLAGMRLIQPGGFFGAGDALALVNANQGELPGVEEMAPIGAVRKHSGMPHFLEKLREDERFLEGTHQCALPLLAVGGEAPYDWRLNWMTGRLFQKKRNDFVVTLESSAPRLAGVTSETVVSDHFSYFTGGHGFDRAIGFMKEKLGYAACGDETNLSVTTGKDVEQMQAKFSPKKTKV